MARRGASRGTKPRVPALLWLIAGVLLGLGTAWYLAAKGHFPKSAGDVPVATIPDGKGVDEAPLAEETGKEDDKEDKRKYDFFTVLPEMEVVVPEQELSKQRDPEDAASADIAQDSYLLQVGSFKASSDAEEMKARLALSGIMAQVQQVSVNDQTWHRVRVGPVIGAREADDLRRRLQDLNVDSLVMKNP